MTYILELENKEDFPKVKKLLEQIKGAQLYENKEDEFYEDGTPKKFIKALSDYSDNLKDEDWISEADFLEYIKEEKCRLTSQK